MQRINADQRLVLTLLEELLAQRSTETPQIPLQRYAFALRTFIYSCPRKAGHCQCGDAYYVLVEAMHLIYRKTAAEPLPWLKLVEETTYDAFRRLQTL